MGRLAGDVSVFSIPDLLQHLASDKRTGTLKLAAGRMEKTIHVSPEGLRLLATSNRHATSLGEILMRTGKISRDELDRFLEQQRRTKIKLGELVSRLGRVSRKDILVALREQVEEEIYELFTWSDASFEFHEGPKVTPSHENPLSEILLDTHPASLMLEAARRADELSVIMKVIRDESLVPLRVPKSFTPSGHGLHPELIAAVYREIDGQKNVDEVLRASLFPRFEAMRALFVLCSKGYTKVLTPQGSTVRIAKPVPPPAPAPSSPGPAAPVAVRGKSALLLGDMVKYRSALAFILSGAGYHVIEEHSSGMAALLGNRTSIDVVILDVSLEVEDGLQFLSWVRDNLDAPIVALSGDASPEAQAKAKECGVQAYIAKPFTSETILRTVAGALKAKTPSEAAIRKTTV